MPKTIRNLIFVGLCICAGAAVLAASWFLGQVNAATILPWNSTDTITGARTNVNTSLTNLNAGLSGASFTTTTITAAGITLSTTTYVFATSGPAFSISANGGTLTFTLPTSTASQTGVLTGTDWTTFNGKQNSLGSAYVSSTSAGTGISVSATTGAITITNTGIQILNASSPLAITATTGTPSISINFTGNLKTTGSALNTVQDIGTTSTPQFSGVTSTNATITTVTSTNLFAVGATSTLFTFTTATGTRLSITGPGLGLAKFATGGVLGTATSGLDYVATTTNLTLTSTTNLTFLTATGTTICFSGDVCRTTWPAGASPGGSNTQLQFNNGSNFGGDANLTWTSSTRLLTVAGSSTLNGVVVHNATTTLNAPLIVNVSSGTTVTSLPNLIALFTGSSTSYLELNVQNKSASTTASTDLTVTADNGTASTYYANLGINSSGNADPAYTLFAADDAYLYSSDSGLNIGTATSSATGVIRFFTGGTVTSSERMRITSTGDISIGTTTAPTFFTIGTSSSVFFNITAAGKIGVGTTTPNSTLDVNGSSTVRNALTLTNYGSSGCLSVGAGGLIATTSCAGATNPGGADTQLQYRNGTVFGGDASLTWSSSTKNFTVSGTSTITNLNATGSSTVNSLNFTAATGTSPTATLANVGSINNIASDSLRSWVITKNIALTTGTTAAQGQLFPIPATSTLQSVFCGNDVTSEFLTLNFGYGTSTTPTNLATSTYFPVFSTDKLINLATDTTFTAFSSSTPGNGVPFMFWAENASTTNTACTFKFVFKQ